ncbi:MAG: Hpt domain-containing protein [Betaproteobacteria bacterium]
MAIDSNPEFDVGPLSWVQGEIDQALTRGLESLATFRGQPQDATALKHARMHVHQAAGAIQMVGLDAVVAYTDELERQLVRLEESPPQDLDAAVAAIDKGCRKLKIFLDELVNGAPPVPLKLYPEYEVMQMARGVKAAAPTDLFYPDLSPRPPRIAAREVLSPNKLPSHLVKQRRLYQRGLLAWLRGDESGAAAMRDAISGIEDVTTQGNLRAFWWTVGAVFEGLVEGGLDSGFGVKQLAARIDLQIRRVAEGSAKVADRLRREVLYFVAICAPVGPQVQAVQRAFKLSGLIPSAEVLSADVVRIQPLLREAREQLSGAKDSWLKAASGRAENLPKLKQTLASVHAKAAEIHNGTLMKLTAALVERLDKMPSTGVSEPVAMEYATALLLAESAFENYSTLSADFPKQVDAMLARLDAARQGRPASGASAPMLDEMSKRAQERVLLAQVGREIQANLRHMEQLLDAFFRDHTKRAELATLAKDSSQIRGALQILGLTEAARLLALCEEQIATYADPDTVVNNEDLELLAESLSGLGFYVEAVEQQRPERDRLIAPLIARRLGEAPTPTTPEGDSVEAAVAELRAALPQLVSEVHRAPADAAARDALKRKLAGLRDDAELIGDPELVAQAEAVIAELEAGGMANLVAAVEAIAETSAPAPAISEETQRLLAADAGGLDRELLEIYLLEAAEVLDGVAEQQRTLAANPGDREALRTVRRGFHTLKGSGRMVGLTQLGDVAYEVEHILNRLIEEERPVTRAVQNMVASAESNFRIWVQALTGEGRLEADPRELLAAIAAVVRELPNSTPPTDSPPTHLVGLVRPQTLAETATTSATAPPSVPVAMAPALAAVPKPTLALIDLPELGFGDDVGATVIPLEPEILETIEMPVAAEDLSFDAPLLRLVDDPPIASVPPPEVVLAAIEPVMSDALSDDITIGDVTLSRSLWTILSDEALQHVNVLEHELTTLQFDPQAVPSAAMVRASHTLCGIHRTGGFPLVATIAHSMEHTLLALADHGAPLPGTTQPVLARAVAGMSALVGRLRGCEAFSSSDAEEAVAIQGELDELRQNAAGATGNVDAETAAAALAVLEDAAAVARPPMMALVASPVDAPMTLDNLDASNAQELATDAADRITADALDEIAAIAALVDSLANVHDEVDAQVLPIFLDEAAELFPQAGEDVRAWRRNPRDEQPVARLRRTLHTFKGSARMAGAMRIGELAHLMESRLLDEETPVLGTTDLFDALDEDLDRIAFQLDALRRGDFNAPIPSSSSQPVATLPASVVPPMPITSIALTVPTPLPVPLITAETPVVEAAPVVEPPDAPPAVVTRDPLPPVVPGVPVVVQPEPTPLAAALPPAVTPVVTPLAPLPSLAPATNFAPAPTPAPAEATQELETGARAQLRVRADIIDRLVNEAGEVAIARARVEGELRSLKSNLLELTNSVIRLRTQMREIEIQAESQIQSQLTLRTDAKDDFDPLEFDRYTRFQELTRSLAEGINDVSTVQQALLKNLDDADAALLAQARMSREVQQRLFAIRTVPFGSLSERLYRILRTTARELDKRANLEINGSQVELDRSVLEKLVGPLEHLLRNALDHGIEPRDVRRKSGKADIGEVALTVRQVGNEVVIDLADDGAGINFARVRERAQTLGLVTTGIEPTEAQLIECLFHPGFSTAAKVTQISGRGIGMDVVRSEIAALGGRVEVASSPEKGTRFTLTMPLTLAVAQAVLIRAGGRLWALPAPMVEQVQQVKSQALLDIYIQRKVEWQGRVYPFHYLPRLLGDTAHNPETKRYNSVLLLRSGQSYAAVHVDEMLGNQEVVVKNIGPQLSRVSGISGATVLGSGEIVLIINPVQLASRTDIPQFDPSGEDRAMGDRPRAPVVAVSTRPTVMIVDDSLTVRKITSRLLQREGFAVTTAKDGVDGLQVLSETMPDVILLDIEMPRMDGFEFTKTIKGDPKYTNIPIIMITSRTAEKHRNLAAELGVDMYLGKPYQEDELLRHLREMTGVAATH